MTVKYSVYKFSMQTKNDLLVYDFEIDISQETLLFKILTFVKKININQSFDCSWCENSLYMYSLQKVQLWSSIILSASIFSQV